MTGLTYGRFKELYVNKERLESRILLKCQNGSEAVILMKYLEDKPELVYQMTLDRLDLGYSVESILNFFVWYIKE